jgi:hypothetical protein
MAPQLSLQYDDSESNFTNDDDDDDDDYDDENDHDSESNFSHDDIVNLSERVYGLEASVSEIRDMIKQMMTTSSKPTASNSCWT